MPGAGELPGEKCRVPGSAGCRAPGECRAPGPTSDIGGTSLV
eukprot:gene965-2045_t